MAPRRVVAAVYSTPTLAAALALGPLPAAPDWLELRIDHFHDHPEPLRGLADRAPRPLLLTVRHPAEGGAPGAPTDAGARRRLYESLSGHPAVAAVDVEVRSLRSLAPVVSAARTAKQWLVASFHDFQGMPDLAMLQESALRAEDAGADVFKAAVMVARPGDLARLLDFMEWGRGRQTALAVMGMGPLGRVSRLALAAAGSALNYGYLGNAGPQIPGQWPAATLRERIAECAADQE